MRVGVAPLALLPLLTAFVGGGCGPSSANPATLWLATAGREIDLVLIDHEPPPF